MDPNNQNAQPEHQPGQPGAPASSGSDWQRQAVAAAAQAAQQPAQPDAQAQVPQQGVDPAQPPLPPQVPLPQSAPLPPAPQPVSMPQDIMPGGSVLPPMGMPAAKKKLPFPVLIALAVVAVLLLAAVTYFLTKSGGGKTVGQANKESANSASQSAIDVATLNGITFTPGSLAGYHKNEAASNATFLTYSTSDEKCAVGFGTVNAATQPGDTAEAVVDTQIAQLRSGGSTVTDPKAGDALVLKDSKNSSKTYKLPTVVFDITKDNTRLTTNYSIVILKSGDRAVVSRACGHTDGTPVTAGEMKELNDRARELVVTAS